MNLPKEKFKKIALGTVQFGLKYGIANKIGRTNYDQVCQILDFAYKNKINSLDTANSYGVSEMVLGKYFNTRPKHSWEVTTKIKSSSDSSLNQVSDSSMRLGHYPYAVLAHSKADYLNPIFYENLNKLKEDKIVKKIGVSVYNHQDITEILSFNKPDIIQLPLNILDTRLYLDGTIDDLVSKKITLQIRSVFLQGLFYLSEDKIKKLFFDAFEALKNLKIIANKANLTIAELSLLWIYSLNFKGKIILGVDSLEQLRNHFFTLTKNVNSVIFEEALSLNYNNKKILDPSLWKIKY